jgi:hypothetical protein
MGSHGQHADQAGLLFEFERDLDIFWQKVKAKIEEVPLTVTENMRKLALERWLKHMRGST